MNGNRRTGLALVIPLAILLAVLFSGGRGAERVGAASNTNYEDLETFTNVLAIIQKNYVEEVDTKRLIEGAINGMLTSLDPHSAYLTPELYKELQVETKGSFGGLGIEITQPQRHAHGGVAHRGHARVRAPGVKSQDIILKIDGEFTKDMSLVEAVKKMRGPKNTKVKLTIKRERSAAALRRQPDARDHQDPEREVEDAPGRLRLPPRHAVPGALRRRRREGAARARQGQPAG